MAFCIDKYSKMVLKYIQILSSVFYCAIFWIHFVFSKISFIIFQILQIFSRVPKKVILKKYQKIYILYIYIYFLLPFVCSIKMQLYSLLFTYEWGFVSSWLIFEMHLTFVSCAEASSVRAPLQWRLLSGATWSETLSSSPSPLRLLLRAIKLTPSKLRTNQTELYWKVSVELQSGWGAAN